jgi:tetratricopeptide (TPR) repeat protein
LFPVTSRESAARARVSTLVTRALTILLPLLALASAAAPVEAQERRPTPQQVERARALFTEGTRHYQAGRLDEALEQFLEAWRLMRSPELAYNVARTYERMGEARRGIQFYRHYLRRAAPDAAEREDVERRIRELEAIAQRQRNQVLTLPPSQDALTREARTFFERGLAMYRRRRYEAAMAAFTAAYNFARLPEVIYNIAVTAERLERTQDAIDYYREYARALPRESAERAIIDRRVRELREQRRREH